MSNWVQQLKALSGLGFSTFMLGSAAYKSVYFVDTGHKAFKFNKFSGVGQVTFLEGYHLRVPWFERPVIYNVRSTPRSFTSATGSKDLQ